MAHLIRVNEGIKALALPNGEVYDGPVEVTLTDAEFAQLRGGLFPDYLTDLGEVSDVEVADLPAEVATDAELEAVQTGALGVVIHGANAAAPRPDGYGAIHWIGSAAPTNATNDDLWTDPNA